MQFASREALANAREHLNQVIEQASTASLRTLGDELFAVVGVLARERLLRRHLSDPATAEAKRRRLVDTVFGGKISEATMDLLNRAVSSRWSTSRDLLDAVEELARDAVLAVAERDGAIEDVEDELFRFARVLAAEPRLRDLLADEAQPAEDRLALLDGLLDGKVRPVTLELLRQVVRVPRARGMDAVVERLAGMAAQRRGRSVARVTAAAPLTAEQEVRLAESLSSIYRRPVSVQVELDPAVLGGMVIKIGDEVIDGSVATRLAAARQQLS